MYPVSAAFHAAVAAGNEQKALLIFSDCVFTDADINVSRGIEFRDCFNMEEDLAIGQATSNEISFSLFNDDRYLNDYEFGDFLATMGVLLRIDSYQQRGSVMMTTNNAAWIGSESAPFIRRNGTALPAQPSFAVKSMVGYNNKVYVFSGSGLYAVYDDRTGENITAQNRLNLFIQIKSKSWDGKGMFYNKDTRILTISEAGLAKVYEFCPLGWFTAERPKAPDVIQIDMTCYDWMQKFDQDMPTADQLRISYPITIGRLMDAMCRYVGITNGTTGGFINSNAVIQTEPEEFKTATMRDVVKWIAEAAASNAVIDRDGVLRLKWLTEIGLVISATDYSEFNPCWYKTKQITKLVNRASSGESESAVGTGDEGYLIQDNPLLKGVI